MTETRYAILIGMDNYPGDELPYCVKDVTDLEQTLISHCRFSKDNIHKVTDSKKSVKQQIDEAYSTIEHAFKPKQDLLFFYFSGHGEYDKDEGKSKILFEDDTELTIEDILLRYFVKITPKNQYLLIDACHSGSNVFFKGTDNPEKEIRRLNHHSSELCLMFATESKKKAIQSNDIKNSYFTYFLIDAIKKQTLYDEDGFLTIQAIDNYIKKKVVEKSDFLQIPVSEIRSSGYKIFSFDENTIQIKMKSQQTITTKTKSPTKNDGEESSVSATLSFEDSLLPEHRTNAQKKYSELIQKSFDTLIEKLNSTDLEVVNSNPFHEIEYSDQQKIFKRIIEKSNENGIDAVSGLFEVQQREKRKSKLFGLGSIMDYLYEEAKPDYDYRIDTYSGQMFTIGLSVNAKNVYQVTGGVFALFYQAKYGFAICIVKYHYNWTGTSEKELKFINVIIKPYLLNEDNDKEIGAYLTSNIDNFSDTINSWCEQRKKEISDFKSKVSSRK